MNQKSHLPEIAFFCIEKSGEYYSRSICVYNVDKPGILYARISSYQPFDKVDMENVTAEIKRVVLNYSCKCFNKI